MEMVEQVACDEGYCGDVARSRWIDMHSRVHVHGRISLWYNKYDVHVHMAAAMSEKNEYLYR